MIRRPGPLRPDLPRSSLLQGVPAAGRLPELADRFDAVITDLVGEEPFALLPHYPGATYLALDSAGHNVHLEQPDASRAALQEWAERVGPPERSGAAPLR